MKTLSTFTLLMFANLILSQVGINTTSPLATLDVNGNLIIQNVIAGPVSEADDSVLIVDGLDNNIVKKVTSKSIVDSYLKTMVKGSLQNTSILDIALLGSSSTKLDFDQEDFDLNDEFDVASNTFTPKQDGYYEIMSTINIEPDPLGLTVSTNVSLQILKNSTVIAESSGPLVGATLGLVNVYVLPIRTVSTVVYLTTTDSISFHLKNGDGLVSINVDLRPNENGFFFIKQIR